ncbi:type IV pilin-like G/H family protein [Tumidithrix elongata RA019]|uniref:Type IV pilin-like G/H family protein n=1 Tax=Tumidithrix elongata BACA0141 TaxID=2716417 RepID=A0AAW9PPD5_9CYAN|nr:type IV pilin-like G/H family protein [Tumidithrix elongata RA019]
MKKIFIGSLFTISVLALLENCSIPSPPAINPQQSSIPSAKSEAETIAVLRTKLLGTWAQCLNQPCVLVGQEQQYVFGPDGQLSTFQSDDPDMVRSNQRYELRKSARSYEIETGFVANNGSLYNSSIAELNFKNDSQMFLTAKDNSGKDHAKEFQKVSNHFLIVSDGKMQALRSSLRTYIWSVNKAQQAHFSERNRFSNDLSSLGLGDQALPSIANGYSFTVGVSNGMVVNTGVSSRTGEYAYLGVVLLVRISGDVTSVAIMCESNEPTTQILNYQPPSPISISDNKPTYNLSDLKCPSGSKPRGA